MPNACPICGRAESQNIVIARLEYVDGSEVESCVECFVTAALSHGVVLLQGVAGSAKSLFCKSFAGLALEAGRHVVYLATDESPREVYVEIHKLFGHELNNEDPDSQDELKIIDCYTWRSGDRSEARYAVHNLTDLTDLSIVIQKAMQGIENPTLVLDDASALALDAGPDNTIKFLRLQIPRLRTRKSFAVFSYTTGIHSASFENALRMMFDGVLETRLAETPQGLERYVRIFSLRGAKHTTRWIRFNIKDEGIELDTSS